MYFHVCEHCGAHLDPGEPCDCLERFRNKKDDYMALFESDSNGQIRMKVEGENENYKN